MLQPSRLLIASLLLWAASAGHAQEQPADNAVATTASSSVPKGLWTLTVAPYVHHWSKSPDHRRAFIVSLEKHQDANRLLGLALFRNSFGQPSAYAYAAYHWHSILDQPRLSAKLSAGIIYGYKGEYANKVPLNWRGYSPGLIPSLSYKVSSSDALQVMVLGTAGFALGYNHSF